MKHKRISVVVISYHQDELLRKCLESIKNWADEIVVVDLDATPTTQKIVKKVHGTYVPHAYQDYVELVRNEAISYTSGEWVLILDPDESISSSGKSYLTHFAQTHTEGALNIPRKNIFFGKWIRHTNFWPDYQIRFFSRGTVVWEEKLHSYPHVRCEITRLALENNVVIEHNGYDSYADFIDRQNRYSTIKARERYVNGERFSVFALLFWPTREFLQRYIRHAGFLDGYDGLFLTVSLMFYHFTVELKLRELELNTHALNKR